MEETQQALGEHVIPCVSWLGRTVVESASICFFVSAMFRGLMKLRLFPRHTPTVYQNSRPVCVLRHDRGK